MSDQMILREAVPKDAAELLDFLKKVCHQSDFIETENLDTITAEQEQDSLAMIYDSDYNSVILAIYQNEIVGFCRLEEVITKEVEYGVVVDKDFWNNGIASYLTQEALDWANNAPVNTVKLEVYKNNPAAIHIYEKYGFVTESQTEKTLIMKRMA